MPYRPNERSRATKSFDKKKLSKSSKNLEKATSNFDECLNLSNKDKDGFQANLSV